MDIEKLYDLSPLVNDTERLVLEELGARLEEETANGLCDCQDCVLDVITLALNALKPRYHASLMGTMYAHAAELNGYTNTVKEAVDKAIFRVRANPSHS